MILKWTDSSLKDEQLECLPHFLQQCQIQPKFAQV